MITTLRHWLSTRRLRRDLKAIWRDVETGDRPCIRNGIAEPMKVSIEYLERCESNNPGARGHPWLWAEYPDGPRYYPTPVAGMKYRDGAGNIWTWTGEDDVALSPGYPTVDMNWPDMRPEPDPYQWYSTEDICR
jgi:hypothetical protein